MSPLRRTKHDIRNSHNAETEVGLSLMGQPSQRWNAVSWAVSSLQLLTTQCTNSWEVASTDWGSKTSNRKVLDPPAADRRCEQQRSMKAGQGH
jgi:hypothetical protein